MTAWGALILWPFAAVIFYRVWSLPVALSVTLIGGYLLLPTETSLDLPVLPALDKDTIPALTALVLTMMAAARDPSGLRPGWLPQNRLLQICLALLAIGAFGSALTNGDRVLLADRALPGMRIYDSFAIGLAILMTLIPLFLGRKVLATREHQQKFLTVLVIAASAYAFLALWEVRMSPQLNNSLYGFFPHSWRQHIRGGGFRPIVFLSHGLWLGIFFASAAVAAFGMARISEGRTRTWFIAAGVLLLFTLVMSKVLGALSITLLLLPVVLFFPQRIQLMTVAAISAIVLIYPAIRAADLVPTDAVLSIAQSIDPNRAQSFEYRVVNEDLLLERAHEKPLFGWGGWGRNRVYDERGDTVGAIDGYWVNLYGQGGWFRYIGQFGLLGLYGLLLFTRRKSALDPVTVIVALALAANLIDLLPNSGSSVVTWLLAGALAGRLEFGAETQSDPTPETSAKRKTPVYRRDFGAAPPSRPVPDPTVTAKAATPRRRAVYSRPNDGRPLTSRGKA